MPGPAYRIVTPRLVIRCWSPADAPLLQTAITESLPHLSTWMVWTKQEPEPIDAKIERLRQYRAHFDLGEDFVYGIFDPSESRVLGGTGLHPRVGPEATEIGYWIHGDHIRKGLATEAAGALTRVALEILGLARVEIHCSPENVASASVPKKLGYVHEATLRQRVRAGEGSLRDTMIWSILAPELPTSAAARQELSAFDAAERRIL